MATKQESERLAKVRSRHEQASSDWRWQFQGRGVEEISARPDPKLGHEPVATLINGTSIEDREFIVHAHADLAFVLGLFDRACGVIRQLRQHPKPQREQKPQQPPIYEEPGDYAANCAMLSAEPLFVKFLVEQKGATDLVDAERIAVSVRQLLQVTSRGELNTNPEATARWVDLRAEFIAWRDHT